MKKKFIVITSIILSAILLAGGGLTISSFAVANHYNTDFKAESDNYKKVKNLFNDYTENYVSSSNSIQIKYDSLVNTKGLKKIDLKLSDANVSNDDGTTIIDGILKGTFTVKGLVLEDTMTFDDHIRMEISDDEINGYTYVVSVGLYKENESLNKIFNDYLDSSLKSSFFTLRNKLHNGFYLNGLMIKSNAIRYLINNVFKENGSYFNEILANNINENVLTYNRSVTKNSILSFLDKFSFAKDTTSLNDTLNNSNLIVNNLTLHEILKAGEEQINGLGLSVDDAIKLIEEVFEVPNFYETYKDTPFKKVKKSEDYKKIINTIEKLSVGSSNNLDELKDDINKLDDFDIDLGLSANFYNDDVSNLSLNLKYDTDKSNFSIDVGSTLSVDKTTKLNDDQMVILPKFTYTSSNSLISDGYKSFTFDIGSASKIEVEEPGYIRGTLNIFKYDLTSEEINSLLTIEDNKITFYKTDIETLIADKSQVSKYLLQRPVIINFKINAYLNETVLSNTTLYLRLD